MECLVAETLDTDLTTLNVNMLSIRAAILSLCLRIKCMPMQSVCYDLCVHYLGKPLITCLQSIEANNPILASDI